MSSRDLLKKNNDAQYTQRYNRLFYMHAASLLPLVVFLLITWNSTGSFVPSAVYFSGFTYLLVLVCLRVQWRREVLFAMRREGLVDMSYQPPKF